MYIVSQAHAADILSSAQYLHSLEILLEMVAVVMPHDAPVAVDGNAATKKCIWKGKEGWDTSLCGSESDNPHTHKLLTATQPRAGAGARAGAEFADACTCTLACARVVATMLATTAARAVAVARGIRANVAQGIRANASMLAHTACLPRTAKRTLCCFFFDCFFFIP